MTFRISSTPGTGDTPFSVAIGDLDGDGNLDLAVANEGSNDVTVLLGDGAGGFAPAPGSPVAVGDAPHSVAMGDLDGDHDLDLVVANSASDDITVLLGDGSGAFAPPAFSFPVSLLPGTPTSVALGDLDLDGDLDLYVANAPSNAISYFLGDGAGGFFAEQHHVTGSTPQMLAIGNLNGDSVPDLAVANNGSDNVTILLGFGFGFNPPAGSLVSAGDGPSSIAMGDFDGDGDLDLAVANLNSNNVTVLLGDGTGGFVAATGSPVATGAGPFSIATGDLDGDGDLDLTTANTFSGDVTVLLGDGSGGFTPAAGSPITLADAPLSVAIGDLNGDGRLDLAVALFNDTVAILLNNAPPAVTTTAGTAGYVEGGSTISTAIVDPGVTLSDADNTTLSSATITITGNFAPEDILSFENTNLSTYGNIEVVSYIAGVLRLDSPGATATLTQWQNALQAVTYSNASDDPNTATRTISFVVNDGADDSAPATRDVSITPTNDPAVISGIATGAVTEAGGVNNGTPGSPTASQDLDAIDPDNPNDDWQAVAAGAATSNHFGSYEVTAAGVWTYTLDNSNATVQALNVASTPLTDSFTVLTVDNTPQVVTVTINGADDAPTPSHNTGATMVQGADIAIAATQLDFDDLDNADAEITYTLDTTTTNGTLWLDANNSGTLTAGEELLAGESFTQADIAAGRLHYGHNGSATTTDTFQFDVSDGAGGSVNNQVFTISIVFSPPPPPSTTPSSGDDDITGTEGPDTIAALAGSDTVRGLGGNDLLFGNQDRDSLIGGLGDDTVWGGFDNDAVHGNEGSDLLFGNEGSDTVDGGNGNNTIVGGQDSSDAADSITAGAGADLIWGNGGADTIVAGGGNNTLIGGFGNDRIATGDAADVLFGNEDNDTIAAGDGANTIFGGLGDNSILAGTGNDSIFGNEGNDTIAGGIGADRYVFATGSGGDQINGFNAGEGDRLDLSGQTFTQGTSADGDVLLTLSGGGTIELNGVAPADFSPGLVL